MFMQRQIQEFEGLIRAGQSAEVARRLQSISSSQVSRRERLALANISRRVGLFAPGLKLLTPLVHPDKKDLELPATSAELAEYAVLLMKVGSIHEALKLLEGIDPTSTPEALMYSAFCHMNHWEYGAAAFLLKEYLDQQPTGYSTVIARVNLCASLVHSDQLDSARALLELTLEETSKQGLARLRANLLELRAQVAISEDRHSHAKADLEEAAQIIGTQATNDQLYIKKWQSVLTARSEGRIDSLLNFRKEAEARSDWESIRECDLQMLRIEFSQERYSYLLFGTPWSGFHRRIETHIRSHNHVERFLYGVDTGRTLEIATGLFNNDEKMDCGFKIHRVISALLKDFYAPVRTATLFGLVFPEEHFHIIHSPNRMHQLIWRTRQWLKSQNIPVKIAESEGRFRLEIQGEVGFILSRKSSRESELDVPLELLVRSLPNCFSAKQAQEVLGASEPTVRRLFQKAMQSGRVEKIRNGRSIQYKIVA